MFEDIRKLRDMFPKSALRAGKCILYSLVLDDYEHGVVYFYIFYSENT